jgi:bilirubin oxidase
MHWHGLHVAAKNDGGPHQIINPNTTWSPSFKVRNHAATYWYHPHGHGQTDPQVSKGLAGMFIVKDAQESALQLPRTYGVDDIPLIIQSKAFDALTQIAIATEMDTGLFVNGTLHATFAAPAQVVRFRIVNGSSLRTYNFGFSNNQIFYQIATDGGMLDTTLSLTRLQLSPGERAEVLVNFTGMLGQNISLKSYASQMQTGIYGAAYVGNATDSIAGYSENFLNGADFDLMQIYVVATTNNPITTIPISLIPYSPINIADATKNRTIVLDTIRLLSFEPPSISDGPFGMNNQTFNMDSINEIVYLNTTEIWTIKNHTLVAHPFHIHDIEFNVIEKSGMPPLPNEQGWKDVVLVMPNDSAKFITKFTTFADNMVPYMYHCHLLHHEDDGMMASFLVIDTNNTSGVSNINFENNFSVYPNPTSDYFNIVSKNSQNYFVNIFNVFGESLYSTGSIQNLIRIDTQNFPSGIYFLKITSKNKIITQKIIINNK